MVEQKIDFLCETKEIIFKGLLINPTLFFSYYPMGWVEIIAVNETNDLQIIAFI